MASDELIAELKAHVTTKIGPMARPDDIYFAAELPKTRSGKIMRRLLRDVAEGRALGDTTTLADPGSGGVSEVAIRRRGIGSSLTRAGYPDPDAGEVGTSAKTRPFVREPDTGSLMLVEGSR